MEVLNLELQRVIIQVTSYRWISYKLTWIILSNGAPISTGQYVLVTSRLPIDIMNEHWDHTLIRLLEIIIQYREILGFAYLTIKMVQLITLIKNVPHHVRRGRIHDRRRDHIGHVAMILVLF